MNANAEGGRSVMSRLLMIMPILLFLVSIEAHAATTQLPQTGQTSCWDDSGKPIYPDTIDAYNGLCPGQDGYVLSGVAWPDKRFTDNANGTITDSLTGLVWLKNAECADPVGPIVKSKGMLNWPDALEWSNGLTNGKCGLTDGSSAGDWRLPNINELKSLINLQQADNAKWLLSHGFSNLKYGNYYWTSSSSVDFPAKAWDVMIGDGWVAPYDKSYSDHVWPVRSASQPTATVSLPQTGQTTCWDLSGNVIDCVGTGQDGEKQAGAALPSTRFVVNNDGTTTDNLTGLIWLTDGAACFGSREWTAALSAASALASGQCNLNDGSSAGQWRVPNREEMLSRIDYQNSQQGFPFLYLTSSHYAASPDQKWVVFPDGTTDVMYPGADNYGLFLPVKDFPAPKIGGTVTKNFGTIDVNSSSAAQTITISNSGLSDLLVSEFSLAGNDSGEFVLAVGDGLAGTCGATPTIASYANCTVSIVFAPVSAGVKTANLKVVSNDTVTPQKLIGLSGVGLADVPIKIDTGSTTKSTVVPLLLNFPDAAQMKFLIDKAPAWTKWEKFAQNKNIKLPSGTGLKKVSVQFKTTNGFESPIYSATVFLDSTPPVVTVSINDGASETASPDLALSLTAIDSGNSALEMRLSEDGKSWTDNSWVPFDSKPAYKLGSAPVTVVGPGLKKVYVQIRDAAGNPSKASFASINYVAKSSTPGQIVINTGNTITKSASVALTLTAPTDEPYVRLSNDTIKWGKWIKLPATPAWKLSSGDGPKMVYAQFSANQVAPTDTYSAGITLDSTAPAGWLLINGGASITSISSVNLTMGAVDVNGVTKMCIKETAEVCADTDFIDFAPAIKGYAIKSTGDGVKSVYISFKDVVGNASKPLVSSIILDSTAPDGTVIVNGGKPVVTGTSVSLKLTANNATSMKITVSSKSGAITGDWEPFAAQKTVSLSGGPGMKTIIVTFKDTSGRSFFVTSSNFLVQYQ